jgi:hypothetical protein
MIDARFVVGFTAFVLFSEGRNPQLTGDWLNAARRVVKHVFITSKGNWK